MHHPEDDEDPRISAAEYERDHNDDDAADRAADRYERSMDR